MKIVTYPSLPKHEDCSPFSCYKRFTGNGDCEIDGEDN